jgi:hypothetical protein
VSLPSQSTRRVYVAGSTRDVERVNYVQRLVTDRGWQITFDWTGAEGEIRTDGSWDTVPDAGARIASREVDACRTADLTILLFPPQGGGLGCWIEMGATLAAGGEVWVVEPGRDSVFWQHPNVRRFATLAELDEEMA